MCDVCVVICCVVCVVCYLKRMLYDFVFVVDV